MADNFYLGDLCQNKKTSKNNVVEKLVLYSEDSIYFLDLTTGFWYTTDTKNKYYIDAESIVLTDISDYKENYLYLLLKFNENEKNKKRLYGMYKK